LALLLAVSGAAGCASSVAATDPQVTVVLRYDDYSAKSAFELEARLFDVFRLQGLTLTVGVVPMISAGEMSDPTPQDLLPLSAEKSALLREALADGAIEVGLHGYSHQTHLAAPLSEFAGLPLAAQRERLALGKVALEQAIHAPVTLFIPPWNTYDRATLDALQELGFSMLSAQVRGEVARNDALDYVPFTCYPADLHATPDLARDSGDPAPLVVVLFHSYDLIEANPYRGLVSLDGLSELLRWLQAQPDVRVQSVGQAAAANDVAAWRLRLNRQGVAWSNMALPRWQVQVADRSILASTPVLRERARLRALLWYTFVLAVGLLAGATVARGLLWRRPRLWAAGAVGSTAGAFLVTACVVRDLQLYWRGMTLATLALGACIALWLLYLHRQVVVREEKTW
jgi:peptidoglycan/xylan/chitin deacetylase (PgdA/CDA1 family)/uncharacterized membrane protein YeaQ/YmgE (transglycosylase-associated protein family)